MNVKSTRTRFEEFVKNKLWPRGTWRDTNPDKAAEDLYKQLRNPLVHGLAGDEPSTKEGRGDLAEPVIGKWGLIPKDNQDIELFDTLDGWSAQWPLLYQHESEEGPCTKLCCAALYRAVKGTAMDLIEEERRTP